jgi:hypothetical protein
MIKSRRMSLGGHVARMRETRNAYRILVGKPEGKRPLGRPRRRWPSSGTSSNYLIYFNLIKTNILRLMEN